MNILHVLSIEDIRVRLGTYLTCSCLGNLCSTTKTCGEEGYFELVWKDLVIRRWLRNRKRASDRLTIKARGLPFWKRSYKVWSSEQKLPCGHSRQSSPTFGRVRCDGTDVWLMLQHSADSRLEGFGEGRVIAKLRVCIQNFNHPLLIIDPAVAFQVLMKPVCATQGDKMDSVALTCSHVTERNGLPSDRDMSTIPVSLHWDDHAVFTLLVSCPSEWIHEVDFLESMDSVRVCATCVSPTHADRHREVSMSVSFDDVDSIWKYYHIVPGGAVLLRTDSKYD